MANDEFRESHEERRNHGLKARHETREARAVRKAVSEEIAQYAESGRHADCAEEGRQPCTVCWALGEIAAKAREIGSRDPE